MVESAKKSPEKQTKVQSKSVVMIFSQNSLVFQIPCAPEKAFSGSKHLLRRYLEDVGRLGILPRLNGMVHNFSMVVSGSLHGWDR